MGKEKSHFWFTLAELGAFQKTVGPDLAAGCGPQTVASTAAEVTPPASEAFLSFHQPTQRLLKMELKFTIHTVSAACYQTPQD